MDEQQQLLLWRWSTAVQLASLVMMAAFFAIFARVNPRADVAWWARAWFANLLALTVTLIYWYFRPHLPPFLIGPLYLASKMAFVLMVIQGGWTMVRPGARWLSNRTLGLLVAVSAGAGLLLTSVPLVGIGLHLTMGPLLLGFAIVVLVAPTGSTWLAAGLGVRGLLALAEACAYYLQLARSETDALRAAAAQFLAASSSFDTGSEWLLVLGSVLAVSARGQRELQQANRELLTAQQDLRLLADLDPLTTLANRRALPEIFRAVQPHGAMLSFFDLNGFKQVNDRYGHAAGDSSLRAFALALRDSFRPDDHVLRYGGDEFLAVARGLDRDGASARVEALSQRLGRTPAAGIACGFSVGMAKLEAGGNPEAAVQAADHNMYLARAARA